MRDVLLPLLRLGLGYGSTEEVNLSDYIMLPAKKWDELGEFARKLGVLGIMLDGVEQLESTRLGATRELNVNQKLEWIGEVLQIEQRNRQQISVMDDLATKWSNNGCRVMVMKGQANATLYLKPKHRNPGDIDCYLFKHYSDGNIIARQEGG